MSSRNINDLLPPVAARAAVFLQRCKAAGLDVLVTCTLRTIAEQDALYAQGRTTKGPVVTNAKAGESFHNFGCAFDVVPLVCGKPSWGTTGPALAYWMEIGRIAKECGLEWAGEWKRFREFPHLQYTGGLSLKDLRAGKVPV